MPIKLLTIVGARPQFIKAAMVSRAIIAHNQPLTEDILHTGQHFDPEMSDIFFRQMGIPEPAVNLNINGGNHGEMTGKMLAAIESEILSRKPDWVLVYGDTNSTLAGALAAAKIHVPVAHVEAGLRSFNRRMPEEINRILTDHVSTLLLCPTHAAVANLQREGFSLPSTIAHRPSPNAPVIVHVGDVMYDAALMFGEMAAAKSTILDDLGLTSGEYLLATVHRAENTDDPIRLQNILTAFAKLDKPVVFPLHPRTRQKIADLIPSPVTWHPLRFMKPVSFLDMVQLEQNAHCILTDSGGVQKEACFHGVPCVTLRDETEWVETVETGWNQVVGADTYRICSAVCLAAPGRPIAEYGNGQASQAIVSLLSR